MNGDIRFVHESLKKAQLCRLVRALSFAGAVCIAFDVLVAAPHMAAAHLQTIRGRRYYTASVGDCFRAATATVRCFD
jgi:hypothetical protein